MFKSYTTIQGETWDQIALKLYGREIELHHLIQANPEHREILFFAAGVVLRVPQVAPPAVIEVPRWQQR